MERRRVWRLVVAGTGLFGVWLVALLMAVADSTGAGLESPAGQAPGFDTSEVAALTSVAAGATVQVEAEACGHSTTGSGVVIGDRLLTNRHLTEGAGILAVTAADWAGGKRVTATVVDAEADDRDLASAPVDATALGIDGLELASADPEIGEPVLMAGWVDGRLRVRSGHVHLYADGEAYGATQPVMLIDRATTYGFSGGPVLDRHGRVVALLQSVDLVTSLTLAIPVSQLRGWPDLTTDVVVSSRCNDH